MRFVDLNGCFVGQSIAAAAGEINTVAVGRTVDNHSNAADIFIGDISAFSPDGGTGTVDANGAFVADILFLGHDAGGGIKHIAVIADFDIAGINNLSRITEDGIYNRFVGCVGR